MTDIATALIEAFRPLLPALQNVADVLKGLLPVSDELAFLAQIRANPHDATTRLVYADWLDERDRAIDAALMRVCAAPDDDALRLLYADACVREGDRLCEGQFLVVPESALGQKVDALYRRAEFVRVQVEFAALTGKGCTDPTCFGGRAVACAGHRNERRGKELLARERELWAQKIHEPFLALGGDCGTYYSNEHNQTWRRGFAEAVRYPAENWLRIADDLLLYHPVKRVALTDVPNVPMPLKVSRSGPCYADVEVAGHMVRLDEPDLVMIRQLSDPPAPRDERGAIAKVVLEKRWPGVTFELPGREPSFLQMVAQTMQDALLAPMWNQNFPGQAPPTITFGTGPD